MTRVDVDGPVFTRFAADPGQGGFVGKVRFLERDYGDAPSRSSARPNGGALLLHQSPHPLRHQQAAVARETRRRHGRSLLRSSLFQCIQVLHGKVWHHLLWLNGSVLKPLEDRPAKLEAEAFALSLLNPRSRIKDADGMAMLREGLHLQAFGQHTSAREDPMAASAKRAKRA
eukprot:s1889_g9.t1